MLESWMWKKLLKLRYLASQLSRVEINNSSTTFFWFEKWSPLGILIELTGNRGSMYLGIPINSKVEELSRHIGPGDIEFLSSADRTGNCGSKKQRAQPVGGYLFMKKGEW